MNFRSTTPLFLVTVNRGERVSPTMKRRGENLEPFNQSFTLSLSLPSSPIRYGIALDSSFSGTRDSMFFPHRMNGDAVREWVQGISSLGATKVVCIVSFNGRREEEGYCYGVGRRAGESRLSY